VLSTELRILIRDTGRVWWRLLPLILGVYLLGWLGNELTLRIAVILGDISPWLALLLFAFSFVCTLTAAIVILTLAGRELGIRQLLPEDEREIDDRDTSMTRLLLITLLPFLAMYAAFGEVRKAADRLVVQQFVRYGALGDQQTVLGALYDPATNHLLWMLTFIIGIYVLRRVLDFGDVVLARKDRGVLGVTRTDRLFTRRSALADHHDLPVESVVPVLLVLCGRLGESKLVRPGMEQAARRHGLEDVGSRSKSAKSPHRHDQKHKDQQDGPEDQRCGDGPTIRRYRGTARRCRCRTDGA
jgi:hypothetical protein